jgi:hypothetical protein
LPIKLRATYLAKTLAFARTAYLATLLQDKLHKKLHRAITPLYLFNVVAFQVIELVDNPDVINGSMVDEFFETNFLPYVRSLYDVTTKVHTTISEVLKLLVQALQTRKYNEAEVGVMHLLYSVSEDNH